ncbi:hypothetical protein BDW62DRAFT_174434 [Aspergillus aurantiobrunneus]
MNGRIIALIIVNCSIVLAPIEALEGDRPWISSPEDRWPDLPRASRLDTVRVSTDRVCRRSITRERDGETVSPG